MSETKVMPHGCTHESQDRIYGPGRRLWNEAKSKAGTSKSWRCTVCGKLEER